MEGKGDDVAEKESPDKEFRRELSTRWRIEVDTAGCERGSPKMKELLVACNKAIPLPKHNIDCCAIKHRSLSNVDLDTVSQTESRTGQKIRETY